MNAPKFEKLIPRVVFATPFRLFGLYVSLFCAAVAATFIYADVAMQDFLSRETHNAVQTDFEAIKSRYQGGGVGALVSAIAERSAVSNGTLYLLTDGDGRRLAGNLDTVAADLWDTQGAAQFAYRTRDGPRVS